ncbi:MAG: hypothetical protein H7Y14_12065 [Burkholderiales bacterium]|nr:hypothetical protein [Burkholderiales bacterium]
MRRIAVACMAFTAYANAQPCKLPGERIQWAADYCMARLETDDEIAAGECIGEEMGRKFKDACAAKVHAKTAMCRLAIARGQRHDGVDACVRDPAFVGSTVRNGGVGGRAR